MGIFDAKSIEFSELEVEEELQTSSADGKGFAASGGVANAVKNVIKKIYPDKEVNVVSAQGLAECKKMLTLAKAGKYNGYLLEGMACPGGCVCGAGVLSDAKRAEIKLKQEMANSQLKNSSETYYVDYLKLITEEDADK